MSSFDSRAREWDKDKIHIDRSVAVAIELEKLVPLRHSMKALEYGAGTGLLSFLLKDKLSAITLMDNSQEMINVCKEKVEFYEAAHVKPLCFDLEHNDYPEKFDIIYNQMVLHHVNEVEVILHKFYDMLNNGGYLAIADLYTEDGSFHGPDVIVHLGFDPNTLAKYLKDIGFNNIAFKTCFEIKREPNKNFPVFLLVAKK
ncbi:MAG: class I SAM-dependent methyltransferase [Bacteroidales bacterium]|nr:class I SAM-dependent methyltransferase [Bacteroidales bacterium]